MARLQLGDAREPRLGTQRTSREQVVGERLVVGPSQARVALQQRLDFGREHEQFAAVMIVERLDAEAIAGGEEHTLPRVPDGEGKHAIEPM